MTFLCRGCGTDFVETLPDGSCPECYSSEAIEKREVDQLVEESPPSQHPVSSRASVPPPLPFYLHDGLNIPDFRNDFRTAASDTNGQASGISPQKVLPVSAPVAVELPISVGKQNGANAPSSQNNPVSKQLAVPGGKYAMPKLRQPLQKAHSAVCFPDSVGSQRQSGTQIFSSSVSLPASTAGCNGTKLKQDPSLIFARALAKPILETPGKPNPIALLFTTVDQLSSDVLSYLSVCADPVLLHAHANLLQNTLNIMDTIKLQTEDRLRKVTNTDVTLYEAAYGRKRCDSGDSSVSNTNNLVRVARPRQISSTIFINRLPRNVKEADLFAYFENFCEERSEIERITVPRDFRTREAKGFAFVKLARSEIVENICRQRQHIMTVGSKTSAGTQHHVFVEPYDEEDQYKRRLKYEIFVGGTSSSMSEEDFTREVAGKYGKIKDIYYYSKDQNPGIVNGYAKITFEDPETNKKLRESGIIEINRRKLHCKPCEDSRRHAEIRKKEREENDKKAEDDKENDHEKKKEQSEDMDDQRKCCICDDAEMCILFKPCKHVCVCDSCKNLVNECPYCRTRIQEREKIFIT